MGQCQLFHTFEPVNLDGHIRTDDTHFCGQTTNDKHFHPLPVKSRDVPFALTLSNYPQEYVALCTQSCPLSKTRAALLSTRGALYQQFANASSCVEEISNTLKQESPDHCESVCTVSVWVYDLKVYDLEVYDL